MFIAVHAVHQNERWVQAPLASHDQIYEDLSLEAGTRASNDMHASFGIGTARAKVTGSLRYKSFQIFG